MPWDCPQCSTVNAEDSRYCDCGYDLVTATVDPQYAPKVDPSAGGANVLAGLRMVRLLLGGLACGFVGIGMLVWEIASDPISVWGIASALAILTLGFGLVGWLLWRLAKYS